METKKRLAIITSHPIQYNPTVFRMLNARSRVEVKVFYTWGEDSWKEKFDPGFQRVIKWDIPLLDGYKYDFLQNVAKEKGSHHFKGIINPGIVDEINTYNPDAILLYGWSFNSHLRVLRHFGGKKMILFRGDSTILNRIPIFNRIFRYIILKWVYSHIDKALYVGKSYYDYFRKFGVKKKFGFHSTCHG